MKGVVEDLEVTLQDDERRTLQPEQRGCAHHPRCRHRDHHFWLPYGVTPRRG